MHLPCSQLSTAPYWASIPSKTWRERATVTQTLKAWTRTCLREEAIYGNQPSSVQGHTPLILKPRVQHRVTWMNLLPSCKSPSSSDYYSPLWGLHGAPGAEQSYNIFKRLSKSFFFFLIYCKKTTKCKKVTFTTIPLFIHQHGQLKTSYQQSNNTKNIGKMIEYSMTKLSMPHSHLTRQMDKNRTSLLENASKEKPHCAGHLPKSGDQSGDFNS